MARATNNKTNKNSIVSKDVNTVQDLIESQKELEKLGAVHVGYTIGWETGSDICLSYGEYKKIANSLLIPDNYLVEQKKPITAFREALANTKTSLPKGLKIAEIKNILNDNLLVYALYKQQTKNAETGNLQKILLQTDHKVTLTFDKKSNMIEVIAPVKIIDMEMQELLDSCQAYITDLNTVYKRQLNITKRDVSATCAKFCIASGISTQARGGSYFIPKKHDNLVKAFSNFLERVSNTSVFIAVPCYSSPDGDKAIAKSAKKSLMADIENIDIAVFAAIADFDTGEEIHRLFGEAIAASSLPDVFDILKVIQAKLALFTALVERIEVIMIEINTGMITLPEVRDRLEKFKEAMQLKQMHQKGVKAQIKDAQLLSAKIESFQDFLQAEGDVLNKYVGQITNYLNILIGDNINYMTGNIKTTSKNVVVIEENNEINQNLEILENTQNVSFPKSTNIAENIEDTNDTEDYDQVGF